MRGSKREPRAGAWELWVSLGYDPETGKRHQVSKTFHGGARAADAALRELVDRHAAGRTDGMGVTVAQLLDRWLEECERLDLSPTTVRNYRSQVNGTIRPRLGKLKLHQLTPKHLDDLYGDLKDAAKSPKTIRNVHAILSAALHQAVRLGWVRENTRSGRSLPGCGTAASRLLPWTSSSRSSKRRNGGTPDLLRSSCSLRSRGCAVGSYVRCAGPTSTSTSGSSTLPGPSSWHRAGLPRRAPRPTAPARSHSTRSASPSSLPTASESRTGSPKPEERSQTMPSSSVRSVEAVTSFRPDNVTSFFIRVRDAVGAPDVRLHDLRHFTATQLIHAGMDIRTVADFLGHSDPSLTLRVYSQAIEERNRAAATIMGQVLAAKKEPAALASGA